MVSYLGYSEDEAQRRISAMRLVRELPEIKAQVHSGAITLTNLSRAKSLFTKEAKVNRDFSKSQKLTLLKSLENKTVRQAEKMIASHSSDVVDLKSHEKIRPVSATQVEVKFTANEVLVEKLEKLKGLLAHTDPNISLAELVDKLCDVGIEKWDKSVAAPCARRDSPRQQKKPSMASVRRAVWQRDKCCQRCGSHYQLELDHKIPKAMGGPSTAENLRVLCRSCNQRAAVEVFGLQKMNQFFK